MHEQILSRLSSDYPWKDRLAYFSTIGSTNTQLKLLGSQGAPHGTALIAGHQSLGRGRLGRSFHSPEGKGIYLSVLLRPGCSPARIMHLTCAVAVAVCDAVERSTGIRPGIKWTNDLVWGKQKLGGILTELTLDKQGLVDYCVIGIGINCCHQKEDFPPELQDMATSLSMILGSDVSRSSLAAAMLEALHKMDQDLLTRQEEILGRYRSDCVTLGRQISILRGDDVSHATALDITADGALRVRYDDGRLENVNSGEVSIRGMYGYL